MDKIIEEGRRFAATSDMQISDMSANAPVGTTLAILERTLKVMSAVQARVHYALRQELKLLAGIIRDYTDDDYNYQPESGDIYVKKSDYSHVDVLPVSDPNAATLSQRVVQYQAVIQLAQSAPQIYNLPELHRQMLDVLGIKNADKLVPLEADQKPKDPVTENMNVLKGTPLKAFIFQDHEAHIAVHQSMMSDPVIQQLIGQNPQANMIAQALQSHIAEHVGYAYRQKIEERLGIALPSPDDEMPDAMEKEVSRLMAQAAPQILAQSKAAVAQHQAQQNAQDPVLQMQMEELQIKKQDAATKAQKVQLDAQAKAKELSIREQEVQARVKQDGMKAGAEIAVKKAQISEGLAKSKEAGMRVKQDGLAIGAEIAMKRKQTKGE